jgi:hypothetical protein
MRYTTIVFLAAAILSTVAHAQMSIEDAQAKLLAQQQADQAQADADAVAATQPSILTNAQVDELKKLIAQESQLISQQQVQIAQLQKQLEVLKANAAPNGASQARVGMSLTDLQHIPNSSLILLSENTTEQNYRLEIGRKETPIYSSGQEQVGMNASGPIYRASQVQSGTKVTFDEVQSVVVQAGTGIVISVEVQPSR